MSDEPYSVEFLQEIIESADIPETHENWSVQEFPSKDGWTVGVFYDCGDFDYIEYLISPDGTLIDSWFTHGSEASRNWTDDQWEEHNDKWAPIANWSPGVAWRKTWPTGVKP
jgi:hypothetical protein